jgi:hypothetical protein
MNTAKGCFRPMRINTNATQSPTHYMLSYSIMTDREFSDLHSGMGKSFFDGPDMEALIPLWYSQAVCLQDKLRT